MAWTRPTTTGNASGSKTISKQIPTRGYKSTNKADDDYESDSTNTPKPVGLGRGRGNRAKTGNTSLPQRQKACNTSLLTDKKAGNTSLSSVTKTYKTFLDPNELKAGNTSLSTDNKACNTSLSTKSAKAGYTSLSSSTKNKKKAGNTSLSTDTKARNTGVSTESAEESAKAGYTSLSSSTKTRKTGLSTGNSKVGVTNLNSNTLTSSTQPGGFHQALGAFNNIKSSPSIDFFKSHVHHDPKYQPKYKKFKCRPDPIQQEYLNKARLFHDWLNQPSSYPSEYYNYLHGSLNYWFTPNTASRFKPDLSSRPFVPHPHMHPLYPKTFLKTPHIHQCNSYMLPNYDNHKETIFVEKHMTMVATDMNELDCEAFIGVLLKDVPNKSQTKKRISEYIFFQSKSIGRIPYDSEIAHFLHQKLNITSSSLKNSFGKDDIPKFNTLLMRIHDSCCMGLFGIKLKRRNKPSRGQHSWKKHLTREEKEVFGDPSLVLHRVKKKPKTLNYYQPSDQQEFQPVSEKVGTHVNVQKSGNGVTKNVRNTDIIEIDMTNDEKDTPTIEMFPNAETDPIIQVLRLDKTANPKAKSNSPKVQGTNTSVTASLNKASSPSIASSESKPASKAMEENRTRTQGGWSNYNHVPLPSSWIISNKSIPQKTPFTESIQKKKSFLKAAVVPPAESSNVKKASVQTNMSKSNLPSKSSNNDEIADLVKSSNNEINQSWKQKFILNRFLCDFNISSDSLPPSWNSAEGGCHPLQSYLDEVQKGVRMNCIVDLRTICDNDLKDQIKEAGYDSDHSLVVDLEMEIEGTYHGPSHCQVDLCEGQMLRFLKAVHQENIIWDVGFQMNHLKCHRKSSIHRNRNYTTKCYCPCSNYMKKWRVHMEIDLILGQTGAINCKKKGIFQCPEDLYAHLHSLAGSCLIHRALAMYLRHLYPEQVKNKKYEGKEIGEFDFKPREDNLVSLPLSIKNIPVNLTLFEIKR